MNPQRARPAAPPRPSAEIESAAADWVARVDAGLTREEQQIFQDWLAKDVRHAEEFDRLTEAWSVFDRVQEAGAASVILDRLEERRRARRRLRQAAVAAAVLVAFILGASWFALRPARGAGEAQVAVLSAPVPDPVRKLPDGSIVELNAGAVVTVHYTADARRVKLVKGEAFFRVQKDPSRPFYVEAQGVVVRAVGTAFTVNMQQTEVEVLVREGAVDVNAPSSTHPRNARLIPPVRVEAGSKVIVPIPLTPLRPALRVGEAAPVPAATSPVAEATPAPEAAVAPLQPERVSDEQMNSRLAWRNPWIEFEGVTLAEAVERMNRHNRLQLRLEDSQLGSLRVSGTIRSDNPEGFVRVLERSLDLEAVPVGDHEMLLRRGR